MGCVEDDSAAAAAAAAPADINYKLLCNRASAWLRLDEADLALRDSEAAIGIDRAQAKAWYKAGAALLCMKKHEEAKMHFAECLRLRCAERDAGILLRACDHFVENSRLRAKLEEEESPDGGPAALSPFLADCCAQLTEDEDDCDIDEVLETILAMLRDRPASKLFIGEELWKAFLFYLTDTYGDRVASILKEAISGSCFVEWPTIVISRLLSTVAHDSFSSREKERALVLLEHACATNPIMKSWFLAKPSKDVATALGEPNAVVPLCALFASLKDASVWSTIPVGCAKSLAEILRSYCSTEHDLDILARIHLRPISELLFMFKNADGLRDAFEELHDASIPSHFDRITTQEEAEKFFQRERKRMYNRPVIQFKHSILDALNVLVRKKSSLSNEAFLRHVSVLGKASLKPSSLLADLLSLVKELHSKSPLKSTPVLAHDCTAKSYEKRPFAADFSRNPFGDAFVEEEGEENKDGKVTVLEKALDVLLGCCNLKNAAITLCAKNIHGLLCELSKYATESVVQKTMKLYTRLCSSCDAFVSEITSCCEMDMVAMAGLLLTSKPELQVLAMNKVLLVLSTCSGDDFAWWTNRGSGLDSCYTTLCRVMMAAAASESPKVGTEESIELCKSVFLQCLERSRSSGKVRIPKGGAWDSFGDKEILEMEAWILKKDLGIAIKKDSSLNENGNEKTRNEGNILQKLSFNERRKGGNAGKLQKGFFGQPKGRSARGKSKRKQQEKARLDRVLKEVEDIVDQHEDPDGLHGELKEVEEVATNNDKDRDDGGLTIVWDSARGEDRNAWLKIDHRDKLSWTQSNTEVTVTVRVPKGTKAKDVEVKVTPTRLLVKLGWYGRVFDGPLSRRCKASESWWILDDESVEICIPKDDSHFWRSLFEGGEMKSYYEVLQELVHADEPTPSYEDLPDEAKDLVDELRERQELVSEGLIDPDIFDDFRCVLSDGDGAK